MKQYLPWTARIILSALFLLSGISKMLPIWLFEKQMIDLGIADWCTAPYLARLIIALEIAIGIAVLQKHFLKRLVLPVTTLLLVAFCIHLSMEVMKYGAGGDNCGCFGQLIKMTPLEALIKNILTIGLIVYIYRNVNEHEKGKNNLIYPFSIFGFSALFMFMVFPFSPCNKSTEEVVDEPLINVEEPVDSIGMAISSVDTMSVNNTPQAVSEQAPAKVKSMFAEFKTFNGKAVNLDEGKKIVCAFAPGCEHCQALAAELAELNKTQKLPEVYVLFMEEETEKIPDFFKTSKLKASYKVLDIPKFWTMMGNANTPGLWYLWNGNVIKSFEGTDQNAFNQEQFLKALNAK